MVGSEVMRPMPTLQPTRIPTMAMVEHFIPGVDGEPQPWDDHEAYSPNASDRLEEEDAASLLSCLTESQEKFLSICMVLSALLSILGSTVIVIKVVRLATCRNSKRANTTTMYDRLLLGLSCSDIIASISFALTPFLLPQESSTRVWAIGTDASCTALGFLLQLSYAAMLYNGLLSYYYLLVVRFSLKSSKLVRWECWMHTIVIGFPLVTASLGAAVGLFHEMDLGFGCWANDYPQAHIWGYIFGAIPFGFTMLSLATNNLVIYRHIRRTFSRRNMAKMGPYDVATCSTRTETNLTTSQRSTTILPDEQKESEDGRDDTKAALQEEAIRQQRIREVATQGFLYVGTFVFSYWSPFCIRILEQVVDPSDSDIYGLLVIQSICLPLQGFFNMFVYVRPSYTRVRAAHPELSMAAAFYKACWDTSIPRLNEVILSSSKTTCHLAHHQQEHNPDRLSDILSGEESQATIGTSNVSPSLAGTTTPTTFFPTPPPDEFFEACAQSVLSSSARSIVSCDDRSLHIVLEEDEEEDVDDEDELAKDLEQELMDAVFTSTDGEDASSPAGTYQKDLECQPTEDESTSVQIHLEMSALDFKKGVSEGKHGENES